MRPLRDVKVIDAGAQIGPVLSWPSLHFHLAKERAAATGEMVCSTLAKDGTPLYFLMPRETEDSEVDRTAFRAREGRPMTDIEAWVADKARNARAAG